MNKSHKFTTIIFILAAAVFIFGAGFRLGEYKGRAASFQAGQRAIDAVLFWQAWDKLQEKFVDKSKLKPQKMFYGAVKGMVASLGDPYTFFLTPEENKQSKEDLGNVFEGIGAQLGLKDGWIVVIAPLKNSPAQKAGLLAGDIIIKVNNDSTEGWTLPYAVSKIRGQKNTKVKLTIQRDEKELVFEITRAAIEVDSVELTYEKEVAILKLVKFGDETPAEWNKAAATIRDRWESQQIKGMILDLRDNPGGYLEGSVLIASEFLPEGTLIVKQEKTDGTSQQYKVNNKGKLLDIPLVVLINKGSASASEIVAGALRDHKRAKLVGEKSFGKGSIQETIELKGGAGLHVTIAKWILPKGAWINHTGVKPDINVENKLPDGETVTRETDSQLAKALEMIVE